MAAPKAPSLSEALVGALDDLTEYDFDRFKLYLRDSAVLGEFEVIRRSKLKTENSTEILKAMEDSYGIFTIVVMKTVLTELHCGTALQELSLCRYDPYIIIAACRKELQSILKSKFKFLIDCLFKSMGKMPFDEAYTELFIIEADTGQVIEEHEVRQIEIHFRISGLERTIRCQDIFDGSMETGEPIRAVLTKGVAGVGKTVLTQKFSLDWAEGRAHQDIQLLFHFTFRYLNKFKGQMFSLVGLLHHCFRETKTLFSFQCLQLLFIFDGLDECRLPLDFSRTRVLTDPTESASVEELLVNLIRGDLLPSARLWITTRPAAANQIPAECVSMVTEVRGFTNEQKEQYFMKRIQDEQQATAIISHIKKIHSLYIMCYIPIFCWILSNVLLHLMKTGETAELPITLTQMYVHFLVIQAKVKNIKFHGKSGTDRHWTPETIEMVLSLGKLSFEQLLKGNLIFYESDLSECGLDAAEIAQSGVFTEVFREESGLYQDKVYCFIHLSVQEFLAALHVHHTFFSSGVNLLSPACSSDPEENLLSPPLTPDPEENLLSPPLTPDPEENLLSPPLTPDPEENLPSPLSSESQRSTTVGKPRESRVKTKIQKQTEETFENPGSAKTHTSRPRSLASRIKSFFKSSSKSSKSMQTQAQHCSDSPEPESPDSESSLDPEEKLLSPPHSSPPHSSDSPDAGPTPEEVFYRSAVDQALQSPNGHLDLFLRFLLGLSLPTNQRLLPGQLTHAGSEQINRKTAEYIEEKLNEIEVSAPRCTNLLHCLNELNDHNLVNHIWRYTTEGLLSRLGKPAEWRAAAFLLLYLDSDLEHFDLRKYEASEMGLLKLLQVVSASTKVTLSGCGLTSRVCPALASALSSSSLTQLDLSHNDLQDVGVKLMCEGLKSAPCRLDTLSLSGCGLTALSCGPGAPLASVLSSSSLTQLDLSNNDLLDSGVELLCEGLKSAPCRLEILRLSGCMISERGGASLAAALSSSHLTELDLSYNHPGSSVQLLTALRAPHGPLQTLRLDPAGGRWMVPGLRKYSCEFSLDPNTAHRCLLLSEDLRSVSRVEQEQQYPDHEDRFTDIGQVLSSTGLRGRCYWEVDWSRTEGRRVDVAMSYRRIIRSGRTPLCAFGENTDSWSQSICDKGYESIHFCDTVFFSPYHSEEEGRLSGRMAVFLDSEAGLLSFYKVQPDGALSHIYTFNKSFTEPLFPGFSLYGADSVTLVNLNTDTGSLWL